MNVTIREANFSDQEQIAALQEKHGIEADSLDDWNRIWRNNPEITINQPIGWVLEHNNKIVGYIGNVPLAYYYKNKKITASAARGWIVESNFRNQALILALKYINQQNVDILINSSSNNVAFNIFTKLGCLPPKNLEFSHSYLWIISPKKISEAFFLRVSFFKIVRIFLSVFFIPILVLIKFINSTQLTYMRFIYQRKFPNIIFKIINPDSSEFDDLFFSRLENNAGLFADRSSKKIRWFSTRQSLGIKILGCYIDNVLSGYSILTIKNIFNTRISKAILSDFIAPNTNPTILKYMLISSLDLSKKMGVAFFEINPGTKFINYATKGLLPIKRSRFATPFTYKVLNKEIISSESMENINWELITNFDGDSAL